MPSDWARLRDVRLRALRDAPDAFGSTVERELGFDEEEWRRRLENAPHWSALVDGNDVGIVSGGTHDGLDAPWVYSMWVEPLSRGHGVAEELLTAVVAWARGLGAASLGLDVTDRAPRARRFYERLGFVASGESLPLPRDPSIQLLVMYLDVSSVVDPSPR